MLAGIAESESFTQYRQFIQNIDKKLQNAGVSPERREKALADLERKYRDSDIFCPVCEMDQEEEDDIEEQEEPAMEVFAEPFGGVSLSPTMTPEQRIMAMQKYYETKNVFDRSEMIDMDNSPINQQGAYGRTKLHDAVIANDMNLVRDLIANGADPAIPDRNGHTPYTMALLHEREDIITFFEEIGVTE